MGETEDTETTCLDEIAINKLHAGDGDGAGLVFTFNDTAISVSVFPTSGSSARDSRHLDPDDRPLQDRVIDLLERASTCEEYDEYDELEDEVFGIILAAGRPIFTQAVIPKEAGPVGGHPSLHGFLFPAIRYFRLEATAAGHASIVPISPNEAYASLEFDPVLDAPVGEEFEIDESLPRYLPSRIAVAEVILKGLNSVTARVEVDDRDMFCKARGGISGLLDTGEGRELECLVDMRRAIPHQGMIRVPQLLGYIQHEETRRNLGFLREWLPGHRLSDVDVAATAIETRRKWISQIRESVRRIHEEGLVWGDGKPGNVIIDEREDAWLIEFGGGYTDGWVDKDLAETRDGDEQAVGRIEEFLGARR